MTFPDPRPWSNDELKEMADDMETESAFDREMKAEDTKVSAVAQAVSDILPLSDPRSGGMDDHVGQRLAALHFEICACDALQVSFDEADELLAGLREERDELDKVILGWSQCLAGGVG